MKKAQTGKTFFNWPGQLPVSILINVFVLILTGCASAPEKMQQTNLVWPPPPQQPRIEFVRTISNESAVNREATIGENIANFLGGEKPKEGQISSPMGLVISDDGQRLYVSDFARSKVFVFDFENHGFHTLNSMHRPVGLALDGDENLYVAEQETRGASVYDRDGNFLRFITDDSIERPAGVAVDRNKGKLYLVDSGHSESTEHTVKIFDLEGKLLGHLGDGRGGYPGQFLFPTYIAVDASSNVYVSDTLNSRVQKFDPDGNYLMSFGGRGNGWGMFDKPKGVALDSFGNVYVADSGWSNVQIFNSKGEILLFFGGRGPIPGMLKNATDVSIDSHNNIYVGDYINHRVEQYRLVNTTAADSFSPTENEFPGAAGESNEAVMVPAEKTDDEKSSQHRMPDIDFRQ